MEALRPHGYITVRAVSVVACTIAACAVEVLSLPTPFSTLMRFTLRLLFLLCAPLCAGCFSTTFTYAPMPAESMAWSAEVEAEGSYLYGEGQHTVAAGVALNLWRDTSATASGDAGLAPLAFLGGRDSVHRVGVALYGGAMWLDPSAAADTLDRTVQREYRIGSALAGRYGSFRYSAGLQFQFGSMRQTYSTTQSTGGVLAPGVDSSGQPQSPSRTDTFALDASWVQPALRLGLAWRVQAGDLPVAFELGYGIGYARRFMGRYISNDPDMIGDNESLLMDATVRLILFERIGLEAATTFDSGTIYWRGTSTTFGVRLIAPL